MKHIEQAPDIPGARKLLPDEPAQAGDRFIFMSAFRHVRPFEAELRFADLAEVDLYGCIKIGRSLEGSRDNWVENMLPHDPFDGVLYRPLS